jgi:glutathione S-transferase
MMRLHWCDLLMPRKVCALARHLRLPIDFRYVDVARGAHKAPQFLAVNPNGQVPVLQDDGRTIWESNAILCHLAMRAGSAMWPADAAGQTDVIRWFLWENDRFTRAGGALYFEYIVRPRFGLGPPDAAAAENATQDFRRAAALLDAHLNGRPWLLGDVLTVADFAVANILPYADAARIPVMEFPRIAGWHGRLNALPGWRDPFPAAAANAA